MMVAATDSPRWCATCNAYGDHHTDRHPLAALVTGGSNTTYVVDAPCPKTDAPEVPCEIARITHYGEPTPHLMCLPHGEVVGYVEEAR